MADGEDGENPLVWERAVPAAAPVERLPDARAAFRVHQWTLGAAALPLMLFLVPVMQIVWLIIVWRLTHSQDMLMRIAAPLGMISSMVMVAYMANWLALVGNRRFERKLREVLQKRFKREGGEIVGVATPDGVTFIQRQIAGHSDVGILYEDEEQLVFEGLRDRRVIARADIVDVGLAPNWQFIQLGAQWCVVRHRVREGDDVHIAELRFVSRRERTIRRNVWATRELCKRLSAADDGPVA